MTIPAPFVSQTREVLEDWIDYNGHMNMAYYNVLFDKGADDAFELFGLGPDYKRDRKLTTYTAEIHLCYIQELHLGAKTVCHLQLVDFDEKRMHFYKELRHVDGWLAATCEALYLSIDMAGPRVSPFPPDILERIKAMYEAHKVLGKPERLNRSIAIKHKA